MQPDSQPESDVDGRKRRVRQVVMDCLHRRNQGEVVADDAPIAENADLMPELGEDLRLLGLLQSYRSDSGDAWHERSNMENVSSPWLHRAVYTFAVRTAINRWNYSSTLRSPRSHVASAAATSASLMITDRLTAITH